MLKAKISHTLGVVLIYSSFSILMQASTSEENWFQTWDRPEYQEWAKQSSEGYVLHIIRKEKESFLVVKAKLIMGQKGLPGFEVVEQCTLLDQQQATKQIQLWQKERARCVHSDKEEL